CAPLTATVAPISGQPSALCRFGSLWKTAPITPSGIVSQASPPASTVSTPPPTGPYAPAPPGVPGVSVMVGVNVGVMVIGAGRVGVGARVLRSGVGSSALTVSEASGVMLGVSVATIGNTSGSSVAVTKIGSGVGGAARKEPQPAIIAAASARNPNRHSPART